MATGAVTLTTAANLIAEAWASELNRAVTFDIVVAALFKDRSSELRNGDVLHIPASHHLTASTKTAGTDLTSENVTEGDQTFTSNTHQATAQTIEDPAEIQAKYNLRSEYNSNAAYSLARAMDVAATALLDDNTTQTVGVLGSELTEDNLLRARQYLRDSGFKGDWVGCIAPATYNGLIKLERFSSSLYVGDQSKRAINQAQLGKLYGATFYESQLLVGTAPNASGALWIKGHFFKIIQRGPTPHSWYSPFALSWVLSTDQFYGVFELQEADEAAAVTTTARLGSVRLQSRK